MHPKHLKKVSVFDKGIVTVIVNAEGSANLDILLNFFVQGKPTDGVLTQY